MGFYIDMINVEEGDSFLLNLDDPDKGVYYILIDGGPAKTADSLVRHLKDITAGHIHVIMVTHFDIDHIGGLKHVIENMSVGCILLNTPGNLSTWLTARDKLKKTGEKVLSITKIVENLSMAEELLNVIKEKSITVEAALAGRSWMHGEDIKIEILSPTEDILQAAWADELLKATIETPILETAEVPATSLRNNAGIILELAYKGSPYALFAADVGADVIKEVTQGKQYRFLKVPHHGSKTGLDEELLKQIKPEAAYLSVGDNPHGHPATEVLDVIKDIGAKVYCTNRTEYCRAECVYEGFGNLCHKRDKDSRPGWSSVDPRKCINNT